MNLKLTIGAEITQSWRGPNEIFSELKKEMRFF